MVGSQLTACQAHAVTSGGIEVLQLAPEKPDFTACDPEKSATYTLYILKKKKIRRNLYLRVQRDV